MNALGFPDYKIQNPANGAEVTFNSGTPDATGSYWTLDGDLGGWESPEGRVTMLGKIGNDPSSDGEIPADLHYKGRTITMKLSGECPSEVIREQAIDLLGEVLDMINAPGLFLANEAVPVQCSVFRSGNQGQGKVNVSLCGYKLKESQSQAADGTTIHGLHPGSLIFPLEATVELYAADPRKYIQTPITFNDGGVGHVTLSNTGGNALSLNGKLIISTAPGTGGPALLITITGPGGYSKQMRLVTPTVPAGAPPLSGFPSTTVVDFYNKTITDLAGNNYYYLRDLTTPWPAFPPGTVTITTSPASAFTGTLAPAYI